MTDEILATLQASAPRRWLSVGMLSVLALMLFYLGFIMPFSGGSVFVILCGAVALFGASRQYAATEAVIELTKHELRVAGGPVLALMDEITRVERGAFAFKPSNGFLITLSVKKSRIWAPGMYWRVGRRMGIGGVTPASHGKYMAEAIATLIAEREIAKDQ